MRLNLDTGAFTPPERREPVTITPDQAWVLLVKRECMLAFGVLPRAGVRDSAIARTTDTIDRALMAATDGQPGSFVDLYEQAAAAEGRDPVLSEEVLNRYAELAGATDTDPTHGADPTDLAPPYDTP